MSFETINTASFQGCQNRPIRRPGWSSKTLVWFVHSGSVPAHERGVLFGAGLGEYLADPSDEIQLGEGRIVSAPNSQGYVYAPAEIIFVRDIVRWTMAQPPLAERKKLEAQAAQKAHAEQQKAEQEKMEKMREATLADEERRRRLIPMNRIKDLEEVVYNVMDRVKVLEAKIEVETGA